MTTRFTPTCVGTFRRPFQVLCSPSVHPHVRGDLALVSSREEVMVGSPPRAWGPSVPHLLRLFFVRFTPTCVGTLLSLPPLNAT